MFDKELRFIHYISPMKRENIRKAGDLLYQLEEIEKRIVIVETNTQFSIISHDIGMTGAGFVNLKLLEDNMNISNLVKPLFLESLNRERNIIIKEIENLN